jgi:hypothetical protein
VNEKYMTDGPMLVGPVVPRKDLLTGETLGVLPENRERFLALASRYLIRRHRDGWFVNGARGRSQIWEYGVDKLGLTVTGRRFVRKCQKCRDWLVAKSIGDDEANFWCFWTEDNLRRLVALARLQKRPRFNPSSAAGLQIINAKRRKVQEGIEGHQSPSANLPASNNALGEAQPERIDV